MLLREWCALSLFPRMHAGLKSPTPSIRLRFPPFDGSITSIEGAGGARKQRLCEPLETTSTADSGLLFGYRGFKMPARIAPVVLLALLGAGCSSTTLPSGLVSNSGGTSGANPPLPGHRGHCQRKGNDGGGQHDFSSSASSSSGPSSSSSSTSSSSSSSSLQLHRRPGRRMHPWPDPGPCAASGEVCHGSIIAPGTCGSPWRSSTPVPPRQAARLPTSPVWRSSPTPASTSACGPAMNRSPIVPIRRPPASMTARSARKGLLHNVAGPDWLLPFPPPSAGRPTTVPANAQGTGMARAFRRRASLERSASACRGAMRSAVESACSCPRMGARPLSDGHAVRVYWHPQHLFVRPCLCCNGKTDS